MHSPYHTLIHFLQQYYKKIVQLVSEKRELYRDKLQSLLQAVTIVTSDLTQQEGKEGSSPCGDDILCDIDEEQTDQFLDENDDGMFLIKQQGWNLGEGLWGLKPLSLPFTFRLDFVYDKYVELRL